MKKQNKKRASSAKIFESSLNIWSFQSRMDSLEPRLKRCRSCGACSKSMDKCQTCKNKYKIKWSVSFNSLIFNGSACFISKWPGPSKTWLLSFLQFVSLHCCPYSSISDIFNIFNRHLYTYVFIALVGFKQIHQCACSRHYFSRVAEWRASNTQSALSPALTTVRVFQVLLQQTMPSYWLAAPQRIS